MQTGPMRDFIQKDCLNLVRFVNMVKTTFWNDWDNEITKNK
jgi:hypothetical protein